MLNNDPIRAIRYPKNGKAKATSTVLATSMVRVTKLVMVLLQKSRLSSIVIAIGVTINAYLVKGVIRDTYIATFELNFSRGRFNVT